MLLAPRRLSKFSSQQSNLPLSLELCFRKHFLFFSSAQSVEEVYIGKKKKEIWNAGCLVLLHFFVVVFLLCEDIENRKRKMECRLLAAFAFFDVLFFLVFFCFVLFFSLVFLFIFFVLRGYGK